MSEIFTDYRVVRGSDVERDGMFLELTDRSTGKQVAEVFFSDATQEMMISVFHPGLPLRVIEALIEKAKHDLPPAGDA